MVSLKRSQQIRIGILRPYGTSYEWGCLRKWRICLPRAICLWSFTRLWLYAKSGTTRFANNKQSRQGWILEEVQVLHPPGLLSPQMLARRPRLEPSPVILDLQPWTSAQAREESLLSRGWRGLQMEGVCTVEGLTIGRQNVQQERWLRCSQHLERMLSK